MSKIVFPDDVDMNLVYDGTNEEEVCRYIEELLDAEKENS